MDIKHVMPVDMDTCPDFMRDLILATGEVFPKEKTNSISFLLRRLMTYSMLHDASFTFPMYSADIGGHFIIVNIRETGYELGELPVPPRIEAESLVVLFNLVAIAHKAVFCEELNNHLVVW